MNLAESLDTIVKIKTTFGFVANPNDLGRNSGGYRR